MKGFYILPSYMDAIMTLPAKYQKEASWAVMVYGATGHLPEDLDVIVKSLMLAIIPNIEAGTRRAEASRENGKLGGRPRNNDNLSETQCKPKQNLEETYEKPSNNLDKTKVKPNPEPSDNLGKTPRFSLPPTPPNPKTRDKGLGREYTARPIIKDVVAIGKEIGLSVESCRQFHRYYDAQHWQYNSGLPIDDVKAALERWKMREEMFKSKNDAKNTPFISRQYSKEELDAILGDTEDFTSIEL